MLNIMRTEPNLLTWNQDITVFYEQNIENYGTAEEMILYNYRKDSVNERDDALCRKQSSPWRQVKSKLGLLARLSSFRTNPLSHADCD